jgi:CheY-like chemotaxis protein
VRTLARTPPNRHSPRARAFTPEGLETLALGAAPAAARPGLAPPARPHCPGRALSPAARPLPRPSKTVLIVEDDDLTREMLASILQTEGYPSEAVGNGQEALARLRAAAPPDLILLDLWMPVMNGWEFCAARARDPLLASGPVVIISATGENEAEACPTLTAVAHLRKPITVEELLDVVRRC